MKLIYFRKTFLSKFEITLQSRFEVQAAEIAGNMKRVTVFEIRFFIGSNYDICFTVLPHEF